ncbi:hypothetical protein P154DRAFT_619130 [Amniculicola lignicola CBS 123094]|uniref:Uncharacterized protein n=1 Tax=Amniculicola lignicola CBS 123094 TaxID=1392246 RepID=A0A6A5WNK2_9PLEO|nr:hypothetical protein P154DRAFT_619130 [Amniculicola lignicola CBS 123094]
MCKYTNAPKIYNGCTQDPKHVVTLRAYVLCSDPTNVSKYRHCSDEHATQSSDVVFGSSRVGGACVTCSDPTKTTEIMYMNG